MIEAHRSAGNGDVAYMLPCSETKGYGYYVTIKKPKNDTVTVIPIHSD